MRINTWYILWLMWKVTWRTTCKCVGPKVEYLIVGLIFSHVVSWDEDGVVTDPTQLTSTDCSHDVTMDEVTIVTVDHMLITWSLHSHVTCLSLPTLHYKPLQCLHCLGSAIKKMCLFFLNMLVTLGLLQVCYLCSVHMFIWFVYLRICADMTWQSEWPMLAASVAKDFMHVCIWCIDFVAACVRLVHILCDAQIQSVTCYVGLPPNFTPPKIFSFQLESGVL